jgi:hypothetical protein
MLEVANPYTYFQDELAEFHCESTLQKHWKIKNLKSREEAEMARLLWNTGAVPN